MIEARQDEADEEARNDDQDRFQPAKHGPRVTGQAILAWGFGIGPSPCSVERKAQTKETGLIRQNLLVAALVVVSLPAFAKSDKSKVVHKALRESVRVEVLVRGQVARAASGVVVAVEGRTSYVLTNEHVVQRDGLKGAAGL